MDSDLLLAIRLQEEYNGGGSVTPGPFTNHRKGKDAGPRAMSIIDPSWELLDPNPDIRALFLQFNDLFFWGKLSGVEVRWSPRMTLCAGVCSYEGRGGLCSVRLSEPLLKLRPRKDLVETLLHEMIHALLFVTFNNKDHDSHGPEFCKHMNRINSLTGTNISVYHNFHDEVNEYRKHWWLCNGPCQTRKPYFGYVKRAMNRAPSALDPWWADHQRTCGGTFVKIKEPENYSKKKKDTNQPSQSQQSKLPVVKGQVQSSNEKLNTGKSHGVDIRSVIPFSGVGYKLSDSNKSDVPCKVQKDNPTEAVKPLHSDHTSIHRNDKILLPHKTDSEKMPKSIVRPKISVANTRAFINVTGSPIKLSSPGHRRISNQGSSTQGNLPLSLKTKSKIPSEVTSSSQSYPSTSQTTHNAGNTPPLKKLRMDTQKDLVYFFGQTTDHKNKNRDSPTNIANSRTESSSHSSTVSQQTLKVCCPICLNEVFESKINDHLDACLVTKC
ncbi:hypothetical protein GDO86_002809 [Hymenochirus boettgeri]|uniref:DNA-dependent metalloprotease SPRTN n=1 Tax=Hymenochirus boettgeri TaxID=247094 RepID=A0A8T2K6W6_9PIPI|nr:hypothetical protein GDO86_002809 [Hymenochirus boettgeri]